MPVTLYKYVLRELLKVMLTSTAVLTVVMSVAFAIMSVSEAQLGPWSLVKIIALVSPGMLMVALPFSAALAGTLVFFRMSQDNEVTACAVSGIPYTKVMAPVLMLGVGLTIGMFWFSNWVVPRFWQMAEREGTMDAARLVARKVRDRDVIEWRGRVIRADAARIVEPEPVGDGMTPYSRLILWGVAVGTMDKDQSVLDAYTAERAVIDMYRDEEGDRVVAAMRLENATRNDPASGTMPSVGSLDTEPMEIPSFFQDRPQFMSLRRLQKLDDDPLRSPLVRERRADLISSIARIDLLNQVQAALGPVTGGGLELVNRHDRRVRIEAGGARIEGKELLLEGGDSGRVRVMEYIGDVPTETLEAAHAYVSLAQTLDAGEPQLNLSLRDVAGAPGSAPSLAKVDLQLLRATKPVRAPLREMSLDRLVAHADGYENPAVRSAQERLVETVEVLRRGILSRIHERAALALNCALVLLLGAAMSIWLRHHTPLAIFFWCFMPTVVAYLTISSGRQITGWVETPVATGLVMTWAGNALLAALIASVYWKLRRN